MNRKVNLQFSSRKIFQRVLSAFFFLQVWLDDFFPQGGKKTLC